MGTLRTTDFAPGSSDVAEPKPPTLDELLATPTGQQMVAEVESQRVVVEETQTKERATGAATIAAKLESCSREYEVLRAEVIPAAKTLAEHANRLRDLRARYRGLASALRKLGATGFDCPVMLTGTERRRAIDDIRTIKEVLSRSI